MIALKVGGLGVSALCFPLAALCLVPDGPAIVPKSVDCDDQAVQVLQLGLSITAEGIQLTEAGAVREAIDSLVDQLFTCDKPVSCLEGCDFGTITLTDKDGNIVDLYDSGLEDYWDIEPPQGPGNDNWEAVFSLSASSSNYPYTFYGFCTACRVEEVGG